MDGPLGHDAKWKKIREKQILYGLTCGIWNKKINSLKKWSDLCLPEVGIKGELDGSGQNILTIRQLSTRNVMHHMMTTVNNDHIPYSTVMRVHLKSSYHKDKFFFLLFMYDVVDVN